MQGDLNSALNSVDFCRRLIRIPSLTGEEGPVASAVAREMERLGYDEVEIDSLGSVIGRFHGSGKGGRGAVIFDAHMDTVEPGDPSAWSFDPLGGELHDGRIYGRGAADMKGALAAMVYGVAAAGAARAVRDLVVSCTVAEELVEGFALGQVLESLQERGLEPAAVVIGEATELRLNIGQRGRAEVLIETIGRSAHSSSPQVGINAVGKMAAIIAALPQLKIERDPDLGSAILEVTDIISEPYPGASVVPRRCRITCDRRLLVGETPESVIAPIERLIARLAARDEEMSAGATVAAADVRTNTGRAITVPKFAPAWKLAPDHPLVLAAVEALRAIELEAHLGTYGFCTNGSCSAGQRGIPTVGFGPCRETMAHISDEHIQVDELAAAARGYEALARKLADSTFWKG